MSSGSLYFSKPVASFAMLWNYLSSLPRTIEVLNIENVVVETRYQQMGLQIKMLDWTLYSETVSIKRC